MQPLRLAIVDYGMGNLGSVWNAFAFLGCHAQITSDPREIEAAEACVLPGVGAFGEAMARLRALGLLAPLNEQIVERGKPFLGICLGMQLLAQDSSEHGFHAGLGWIQGHVEPIPAAASVRVPHVGWSETRFRPEDPIFRRIEPGACFYFDHSYHLADCQPALVAARCDYGIEIAAVVRRGNIVATQFHPERSQRAGLKLLRNFLDYCLAQRAGSATRPEDVDARGPDASLRV